MVSAWLTGILGAFLIYVLGTRYCGFGLLDCGIALATTNVAGFFSLLLTLWLERRAAVRRVLMGSAVKTWVVLAVLYTSFLAGLDPALRDPRTMLILWAPLVFGTGFMLPLWGLAQDRLIRWEQRRKKRKSFPANQEFPTRKRDVIRVES